MPYPDKLRKMIAEAMQELAPQMYSRLKASGELGNVVEMRAQAAQEEYDSTMELVSPADQKELHQAQNEGPFAMSQAWNRRESRIVENVLAQATEFPTEGEDRTI
jgi:hypothetical protein